MAAPSAVIAEDAPIFQPGEGMFHACAAPAVASPICIAQDSVSVEHGSDEFLDRSVAAIRQDATVFSTQGFYLGSSVVNRIVSVARPATRDFDDPQVAPTDQHLSIARVTVILGTRSGGVIPGGDERPVHDPRPSAIGIDGMAQESCQPRKEVSQDPMHLGLGRAKYCGQFSDGEVGSERGAGDQDAGPQRSRPRRVVRRRRRTD